MKTVRTQRGAILVLAAIFIPLLLGMTALALDVGRIMAVRSEMQNAADAAALAAAAELDGGTDALNRARAAARELLEHDSRFAKVGELLTSTGLPDEAFTFYCIIGSKYDPGFDIAFCDDDPDPADPARYFASTDNRAHYVRVNLDPLLASASNSFELDLYFLPVLSVMGISTDTVASVAAEALAGRLFYFCGAGPIAICDPFDDGVATGEPGDRSFASAMTAGQSIQLKQQGPDQWTHGNFAFLQPFYGGTGANAFGDFLADERASGADPSCSPAMVTTQTGNIAQRAKSALNTRFDEYGPPSPFNQASAQRYWPPAENVAEFTLDSNAHPLTVDSRFGGGTWDFAAYWAATHPGLSVPPVLNVAPNPTRKAVYDWEIASGNIPAFPAGHAGHAHTPRPSELAPLDYDRRLIKVVVLSCLTLGLNGGKTTTNLLVPPDGLANIFLVRKVDDPPTTTIYGEFAGMDTPAGATTNVQILLFD